MRQFSLLQSAMDSYYKLRQLFYYKVRRGLLQIATGITKCDNYYKIATVHQRVKYDGKKKMEVAPLEFEPAP